MSPPSPVPDREYGLALVANYVTCGACGTLSQRPMPVDADLPALYPSDYHSQTGQGSVARYRHRARLRRFTALSASGPILDFGCGNGGFLRFAAATQPGTAYFGFEIADRSEVISLENGAVTIIRGGLDDLVGRVPEIGIITMNHVIEHLPDPAAVMVVLARMLRPGGIIEGQTPAAGSLEHRFFGTRWSGYHAPRHTVVFSPAGLSTVLSRASLSNVTVKRAFNPAGIAVSLASVMQSGHGGRIRRQGISWLGYLGMATLLAPIDLLCGSSGIVDFSAVRPQA